MTASWSIPSSSGRDKVKCQFIKYFTSSSGQKNILASLYISGLFWDRSREISDADLVEDYSITLPQTILCRAAVDSLLKKFSDWLASPTELTEELTVIQDPFLRISIGCTDELICSKDKPALILEYHGGGLKDIRVSYLIDRTCIEIAFNELKELLVQFDNS